MSSVPLQASWPNQLPSQRKAPGGDRSRSAVSTSSPARKCRNDEEDDEGEEDEEEAEEEEEKEEDEENREEGEEEDCELDDKDRAIPRTHCTPAQSVPLYLL